MDKNVLLKSLINQLEEQLNKSEEAANQAHLGAIDDQSIAETQYDTLAIESSYLAEGHSKRVIELKQSINLLVNLTKQQNLMHKHVQLGSLVTLENENSKKIFFILPTSGGSKVKIDNKEIIVITPQSPLGQSLCHKEEDDECSIMESGNPVSYWIANVC